MNADKFFEQYSIEEISKRTKISPISLRYIKNKEYEKIPKVKFYGFINIIEREFKIDLSELIDEYNSTLSIPKEETQKPVTTSPVKKEKNNLIFILSVILLLITGSIIYYKTSLNTKPSQNETNETPLEITEEKAISADELNKTTQTTQKTTVNTEKNITTLNMAESKNPDENITKASQKIASETKNENNQTIAPSSITIIPNEKVWYRAINLDTNKTYEYLTSNPKTLPGSNYFIKFGHGNVTIEYGNKVIEPNTKKIVRILLKNGNYKYVKKGFKP